MRQPNMRELLSDPKALWRVPAPGQRHAVVAMSRQPGARGGEVAEALALRFGMRVFDREIIHEIAQSAHLSDHLVSILDEKDRSVLADWLASLMPGAHISPTEYIQHLTRVVASIARFGDAVILGRGAHLILRPSEALRVFVVAPYEDRIHTTALREGLDPTDAARAVTAREAERRAFLMQYFHAKFGDNADFDLVINTAALGVSGAVDTIATALERLSARRPA